MDHETIRQEILALRTGIKNRRIKIITYRKEIDGAEVDHEKIKEEFSIAQNNLMHMKSADLVDMNEYRSVQERYCLTKWQLREVKEYMAIRNSHIIECEKEMIMIDEKILQLEAMLHVEVDNVIEFKVLT